MKSEKSVTVGVDDKRSYVVAGSNTPEFVGLTRGGFGNPFGVHTTSGKPLATDFASVIESSLRASGMQAKAVPLQISASGEQTLQAFKALSVNKTDRSLLVTIKEWKSDKF